MSFRHLSLFLLCLLYIFSSRGGFKGGAEGCTPLFDHQGGTRHPLSYFPPFFITTNILASDLVRGDQIFFISHPPDQNAETAPVFQVITTAPGLTQQQQPSTAVSQPQQQQYDYQYSNNR